MMRSPFTTIAAVSLVVLAASAYSCAPPLGDDVPLSPAPVLVGDEPAGGDNVPPPVGDCVPAGDECLPPVEECTLVGDECLPPVEECVMVGDECLQTVGDGG